MHYTDNFTHLHVEISGKGYDIPKDELTRMERSLAPLHDAVRDFPSSDLRLTVIHHSQKDAYHVEARLKLPGKTLFSSEEDAYLDSAFQRCVAHLRAEVESYARQPDRQAVAATDRRRDLSREIVMPQDPDTGPLARAVTAGDYHAFRTGLSGYEEWLRGRVGRWIQRYPEAEDQLRRSEAFIGDVLEQVYLHAFEQFTARPTDIRLSEWLDKLIDPALKDVLRDPAVTSQEASLARTVRARAL